MHRQTKIKIAGHYMIIDGEKVQIDPAKTDIPIRCKLALAEILTGKKHEVVREASSPSSENFQLPSK